MKLAVLGASRGVGLALAKMALDRGHDVTAVVRSPAAFQLAHSKLRVVSGDIRNQASVETAIAGQDAVCVCIGVSPTFRSVDVFSKGMTSVLAAMQKASDMKIVSVSGIGAGDSRGHGGFIYDWIVQPLLLRTIYEDKDRQEALLKASGADWMIVRPGMLTNGPETRRYKVLTDLTGVTAGKISRADVADFILNQLADPTYFKQTPLLTY
jgi:putative NADH-flavin reductase